MKPPYPKELNEALKNICKGEMTGHEYVQILENPDLTSDFIRQRLASKRTWYEQNQKECKARENESWQDRILRVVYDGNLGIKVPQDGQLVYSKGALLIIDWRSWCPVLLYCAHTGQRSVPVCSVLYHMQLQYLLSLVLPGVLFTRDYSKIRPNSCCCREVIFYEHEEE